MMTLSIRNKLDKATTHCLSFSYPEIQHGDGGFRFIDKDFMLCGGYVLAPGDVWEYGGKSSLNSKIKRL